jgi:hypothetical protein
MERAQAAGKMIGGWIRSTRGARTDSPQDAATATQGGGSEVRL